VIIQEHPQSRSQVYSLTKQTGKPSFVILAQLRTQPFSTFTILREVFQNSV
jgi:hypothetical protein